jgi:hypothetical protein
MMMPSLCIVILFLLLVDSHPDGSNINSESFVERMSVFKSLRSLASKAKRNAGANDHYPDGNAPFWMERIKHQGRSPFHPDPQYRVFRNVKVHHFL